MQCTPQKKPWKKIGVLLNVMKISLVEDKLDDCEKKCDIKPFFICRFSFYNTILSNINKSYVREKKKKI